MIAIFAIVYYGFIFIAALIAAKWIDKSVFFAVAAIIAADFLFFEYFEHTPNERQEIFQQYKKGLIDRNRMYNWNKYNFDCIDNFVFMYNNRYCTSAIQHHYDEDCSNIMLYYWPTTPVIHRTFVNITGFPWYGKSVGIVSTVCENDGNR